MGVRRTISYKLLWRLKNTKVLNIAVFTSQYTSKHPANTMVKIAILSNKIDVLQLVAQEQQATPSITVSDKSPLQANLF